MEDITDIKCTLAGFTADQLKELNKDVVFEMLLDVGKMAKFMTKDQISAPAAKVKEAIG